MKKPKVSVILSTYNRPELLRRAIDSVIKQTVTDWELIVVDDCSPVPVDAGKLQGLDKRIKVVSFNKNSGSDTKPKNFGLMLSSGEYVAYLDDDCEWLSYHLEVLLNDIERDLTLDVVYCDSRIYWDDGKPPSPAIARDFDGQFLLNRNFIDTSQVLHRRDIVFAVGGWDEKLPKFVDWNLWVRMMKWGAKFQRVPIIATNYYIIENSKSSRIKTKSWFDQELGMTMFEPTFSPSGCLIYLPYLGNDRAEEITPKVAIYTITYDRLEYTQRMKKSLDVSTHYPYSWCVFDNGSSDKTQEWIPKQTKYWSGTSKNKGISYASNHLLDLISEKIRPQIIIKVDNDCEFRTVGWLETIIDLWKRNHMLYMSPYPEGLVQNPGGGLRVGYAYIGKYFVEVSHHIGGLCAAIDARAYKKFRFTDNHLHGNQDAEASLEFRKQRFMPIYIPHQRIMHMDSTEGQKEKYPEYFQRRISEKTTQVQL